MRTHSTVQDRIRDAFFQALSEKKYEQITVTELCRTARISRVTFYSYYPDKESLLDEVLRDLLQEVMDSGDALQARNNPSNDTAQAYWNYFDAFFGRFEKNRSWWESIAKTSDRSLCAAFYKYLLEYTEKLTVRYMAAEDSRFTARQAASFICTGLLSFLYTSRQEGMPLEQRREDVHELLRCLASSGLFDSRGSGHVQYESGETRTLDHEMEK